MELSVGQEKDVRETLAVVEELRKMLNGLRRKLVTSHWSLVTMIGWRLLLRSGIETKLESSPFLFIACYAPKRRSGVQPFQSYRSIRGVSYACNFTQASST